MWEVVAGSETRVDVQSPQLASSVASYDAQRATGRSAQVARSRLSNESGE